MATLGDKREARRLAEESGVPVIPGERACDSTADARAAARRIGYPVLLKAAGGGGGKGMRLVGAERDLEEAFGAARREAGAAFADERLIVEKYVAPARHIEVQILGDGRDAVALGERECSLQRRYQKVIEEAPSCGIAAKTRKALLTAAVKLARAARYESAGTVEFLVDAAGGAHYFLEVNTRLQVEHPVTEAIAGLDLVRAQVEIARGGRLPKPPEQRGHAIEARLNAEDPYRGFLPASGRVLMLDWPSRPGVRIDSGLRDGMEITPFYDPLLAKLIAWGGSREEARRRLIGALRDMTLLGVTTNRTFLLQILERDFFIEGKTYTSTLESERWEEPQPPAAAIAAARRALATPLAASDDGGGHSDRYSPWNAGGAG
jgi:acetyl/propionyl-CoA carboxylase alpha subunit